MLQGSYEQAETRSKVAAAVLLKILMTARNLHSGGVLFHSRIDSRFQCGWQSRANHDYALIKVAHRHECIMQQLLSGGPKRKEETAVGPARAASVYFDIGSLLTL